MYQSLEELCQLEHETKKPFWKMVQEDDCRERGVSEEQAYEEMRGMYLAMQSADQEYDAKQKAASGLVGTEGDKMRAAREKGTLLCGNFIGKVMEKALKISESNACMKRIVAAPTAGACDVLPAVLIPCYHRFDCPESRILEALYTSAGIGQVIAYRASIAGASGGCQAEIGSASSMAAGAMGAVAAADMALAGIRSNIPADQVFDAMREVGDKMDASLRETGFGGLAATPEGNRLRDRLS